jgi:hypothetical protein
LAVRSPRVWLGLQDRAGSPTIGQRTLTKITTELLDRNLPELKLVTEERSGQPLAPALAPWFVGLLDKMLSERLIRHKGIGAEILSAVAEGWQVQHEAWMVQHTSIREDVHELKSQTAILAEILELLRSRTQ